MGCNGVVRPVQRQGLPAPPLLCVERYPAQAPSTPFSLQIDAKSRQRDAIIARLSGQQQQQQPQQPDEAAGGITQEQLADPQALQGLLPHVEAELTQ